MWFWFKTCLLILVLGLVGYGTFILKMGEKTLAGHLAEIWRSPLVQHKLQLAEDGIDALINDEYVTKPVRKPPVVTARKKPANSAAQEEISDTDRDALEKVIAGKKR